MNARTGEIWHSELRAKYFGNIFIVVELPESQAMIRGFARYK